MAGHPAPRRNVFRGAGVAGDQPQDLACLHPGQSHAKLEDQLAAPGVAGVPEKLIGENPFLLCGIPNGTTSTMGTQSIRLASKRNRFSPMASPIPADARPRPRYREP